MSEDGTRTDLPWLRSRSLRSAKTADRDTAGGFDTPSSASLPPATQPTSGGGSSLDLSAPSTPAPSTSSSLDLGGSDLETVSPSGSTSSASSGGGSTSSATSGGGSSSLDLGTSEPPTPSTSVGGGTSLSLSAPSGAPAPVQTSPRGHARLPGHDLGLPSIRAGERRLMTEHEPVVQFTRMQSAAGALDATVAVPNPSEVVLGLVFETSDGRQSLVLPGLSQQGPDPRRPIFRATSSGVAVNLRAITGIQRMLLFAVPTRPSKQLPGGTVTVTTYGGSRLEVPLVAGPTLGAQALMSAYVVEGRIVIRAEHDPYSGTLQRICAAYGYREISWRDPYTPLV